MAEVHALRQWPCFQAFDRWLPELWARALAPLGPRAASAAEPAKASLSECGSCGRFVEEFAQGKGGTRLCRRCLRSEDQENFEPLTEEERRGLDWAADILDGVPWTYWKPGEQPAQILDWLFLGDLDEAMNVDLLRRKGITAVLNLVNWWEIASKRPDVPDLSAFLESQDILYQEADSDDRLFFDLVGKSWPVAEAFLQRCQAQGQRVIVNCRAGHNRSACVCVCWLVVHEKVSLLDALSLVQLRRGAVLSNHGFRLQLVRVALSLQRLGVPNLDRVPSGDIHPGAAEGHEAAMVGRIIKKKRLSVKYDRCSRDFSSPSPTERQPLKRRAERSASTLLIKVGNLVSQRSLSMELLACLWHKGKNFLSDYEYTASPPEVVGSGFSGDVVLCRRLDCPHPDAEANVRCVKRFDLKRMSADKLDKLKNEVTICLSLEHPHIARLFDAYEDANEVSLVMQYCAGGTLEDALRERGPYGEAEFQDVAVQMLRALRYIHCMGIVHRDIKPRNYVLEANQEILKLIDFGFSVKSCLADGARDNALKGCMGTLGYLAPEVVHAGIDSESCYTEKCDLWSIGCVFYELLAGRPAFHRERGQCDGYTEEVVLREIEEVSPTTVEAMVGGGEVPCSARPFLRRLLVADPKARPSACDVLDDPFLAEARRNFLLQPQKALPVEQVIERFRAHGQASKIARAWSLAQARSPTNLPWEDFCALRDTFKMFDAHRLSGMIDLQGFLSVVAPLGSEEADREEAKSIWKAVCGEQESLSYCEFLAALLPPIEDVFQDAAPSSPANALSSPSKQAKADSWSLLAPVGSVLPLLNDGEPLGRTSVFHEDEPVSDVVRAMSESRLRWVIVQYDSGRSAFFDYMDISHYLVRTSGTAARASSVADRASALAVGALANASEHSTYVPMPADAALGDVLGLITRGAARPGPPVRRVPIVDQEGQVLHVFSCLDFLRLALRFTAPSAILKSRSARAFDRRDSIVQASVMLDDSVLSAFSAMDAANVTICPVSARKLSGDLGGVLANNVVSVADLKWVFNTRDFGALDKTVGEFLAWRADVAARSSTRRLRHHMSRFNVVSVELDDSLHVLARRLLDSRLQRIFLSSEELARLVGIVSSRDILVEVYDELV